MYQIFTPPPQAQNRTRPCTVSADSTVKERFSYIDVLKGLLILLVIWDHVPDTLSFAKNETLISIDNFQQWTYKLFFMPAFFCVTGYCSNFNIALKTFILKQLRRIVLPGTLFYAIVQLLTIDSMSYGKFIYHLLVHIILYIGCFWFLGALFVSKMLYYFMNKYIKSTIKICILFAAIVPFGFFLRNRFGLWYIDYSLSLTLFIGIGQLIKIKGIPTLISTCGSLIFFCSMFLWHFANLKPPVVAGNFELSPLLSFPYLLFSTTGTIFIWTLSKAIDRCSILEYIGKNSLIYYVFQVPLFSLSYVLLSEIIMLDSTFNSVLFCISYFLITSVFLTVISIIFNTKYLKWTIGK